MLENFSSLKLNHGVMEAGYVNHYGAGKQLSNSASGLDHGENLSVSMTATMDSMGNLVLGKSLFCLLLLSSQFQLDGI